MTTAIKPLIRLDDISKSFGPINVIDNLSLIHI